MTKTEYVRAVAEKGDFTQKVVKAVIDAMEDVAYEAACDDEVPVFNGLTLLSQVREARTGRDPRTGDPINIPTKRVPKVKVGRRFKNAVAFAE